MIESRNVSQNSIGEDVGDGWVSFASVRGQIVPAGGREVETGAAEQDINRMTFKIRWLAGIDSKMRVKLIGGDVPEIWEIESITDMAQRGRMLELKLIRYDDGGYRRGL